MFSGGQTMFVRFRCTQEHIHTLSESEMCDEEAREKEIYVHTLV